MRHGFVLAALMAMVCGCIADNAPRLSRAEKDIIDAEGIMRVLTVSDKEDSLVLRSKCSDFPVKILRSERFVRLADRMIATVTDSTQDWSLSRDLTRPVNRSRFIQISVWSTCPTRNRPDLKDACPFRKYTVKWHVHRPSSSVMWTSAL